MSPLIVAEIGGNHLGGALNAAELVLQAANAGADAVKFQCFQPEQMCAPDKVLEAGPWAGRNLMDLYRETHTPRAWFPELFKLARELNIVPFASVFHPDDVDFLETIGCPMYKIASFELTDLDLIRHTARTGKPLVISTGMGTAVEIDAAWDAAFDAGNWLSRPETEITLLRCTSAYPADASEANLLTMEDMAIRLTHRVGLSDHTTGIGVAVAAAALGATMIEKHLTFRRADGGPDAAFSMEPQEFAKLVIECKRAAAAIGEIRYGPTPSEAAQVLLRRPSGGKRGG